MDKKIIIMITLLLTSLLFGCAPEEKVYVQDDLNSIHSKFVSVGSDLTDLQKDTYWENDYKNKWIKDSIKVEFVGNNYFSSPKFLIYVASSDRGKLVNINKGDTISFEGRLSAYSYWNDYVEVKEAVIIGRG